MTTPNTDGTPALPVPAMATTNADDIVATPVTPLLTTTTTKKKKTKLAGWQTALSALGHLAFWPFNLLFGSLALFGYTPLILFELLVDAADGVTPWTFATGAVLLALIPLAAIAGGIWLTMHRDGRALWVLLVGVEIPALWVLATRTFGMQELTGGAALLVVGGVLGLAVLYRRVLRPIDVDSDCGLLWSQPLLAVLVPVGAWVVIVMGSFAAPALLEMLDDITLTDSHFDPSRVLLGITVWMAATTFFLTPFFGPVAWLVSTAQSASALWRRRGPALAVATTVGPIGAFVVALGLLWPSPAATTLERLRTLPTTDEQRQALLDDRATIRAGLVDAALVAHRYPLEARSRPWQQAWREVAGDDVASIIDDELRLWAAPFIYPGDGGEARTDAFRLYDAFFGEPLEGAEREAVQHALAATFTRDQRFAALIDEGQRRVRLVRQQVTATPTKAGLVAVEIHDEWSNLTPTDIEIQLSFSLPPSAAITGLWLHDVDDKANAFPFALAPRGAAQQVYREQVAQRVDPALLEQVGPQQYRLRVFPVPARAIDSSRGMLGARRLDAWSSTAGKHAHVWLTYETIAIDGVVPVPTLLQARNAFFDDVAERDVQGERVANSDTAWVTTSPRVPTTTTPAEVGYRLADGSCVGMQARGASSDTGFASIAGKVVDVVIDRSIAMERLQAPLSQALSSLRASGAITETVWTTSTLRNEPATRSAGLPDVVDNHVAMLAFGSTSLKEMVRQQLSLPRLDGRRADIVVVLAARGSFEGNDDTPLVFADGQRPTITVLHLGALPTGYDDATADAVSMSGGIITTSLAELQAHLAQGSTLLVDSVVVASIDCPIDARPAPSLMARLAVRLLDRRRDRSDASTLDRLHAVALGVPVVTPYSSMIVLVSEAQRERLRQLNAQQDRYEREVESGTEIAASQPAFLVTGAPEPEEWLLLIVAMAAIVVAKQRGVLTRSR